MMGGQSTLDGRFHFFFRLQVVTLLVSFNFDYIMRLDTTDTFQFVNSEQYLLFVAAIIVSLGLAVYPLGWNNREVLESCGNSSQAYKLGKL